MDNDNQDYELDTSISYDVSEADSSVASEDTEDTEHHSNVTMTFKHRSSNSPNDVRSYDTCTSTDNMDMDMDNTYENGDNFLPRLGDPLPIVKEGKILVEETRRDRNGHGHGHGNGHGIGHGHGLEREEDAVRAFQEYQQEEAEFAKEMNTTKIAFSAYRSAVLHLVHHQKYKNNSGSTSGSTSTSNGNDNNNSNSNSEKEEGFLENDDENGGGDENGEDKEEDANLRMTILEENAKRMVEIKAKACFQAVDIANEFMERSFERKKGRGALFSELLNVSQSSGDGDAVEEMVQSLDPVNDDAKDMNVADVDVDVVDVDAVEGTIPVPAEAVSTETANTIASAPKQKPKVEVIATQSKPTPKPVQVQMQMQVQAKKKNPPKPKVKEKWKPQKFVRRKKSTKHPDCILATLPVFQYQKDSKEDWNNAKKQMESSEHIPASYGTSSWIGNMIHWRIQRRQYKINSFEKCACPDCSKGLNDMST